MAARVVYRDRRGRPGAIVDRHDDGGLAMAGVRTPAAGWILIEPRTDVVRPWGVVDRLWRAQTEPPEDLAGRPLADHAAPLTVATAIDWTRPRTIPVVAEPARLPPGAGTAILNLVALRARESGVPQLTYTGPYPTEALFLALLESFAPRPDDGDLLARFVAGEIGWLPQPFEPCFDDDVYVQRRDRVEKVVWRDRTYVRERWHTVRRWAPLRVDDDGAKTRCALWALGHVLEEHVWLDADGRPIPAPARGDGTEPGGPAAVESITRPVVPAIRDGLTALVEAMSAPPLAHGLRQEAAALAWRVGRVDRDLVRIDGPDIRIASRFAAAVQQALADPAARVPQAALAMLAEVATALGDPLRARAQARLAAAPEALQREALAREAVDDPDTARRITAAVAALLASGRVDDEPDVEGGEGGDRRD